MMRGRDAEAQVAPMDKAGARNLARLARLVAMVVVCASSTSCERPPDAVIEPQYMVDATCPSPRAPNDAVAVSIDATPSAVVVVWSHKPLPLNGRAAYVVHLSAMDGSWVGDFRLEVKDRRPQAQEILRADMKAEAVVPMLAEVQGFATNGPEVQITARYPNGSPTSVEPRRWYATVTVDGVEVARCPKPVGELQTVRLEP